jgi:dTDP-4-dehydrorhamnose reductase
MKILITGANGLLGQELSALLLQTTDHHIIAAGRGDNRSSLTGSCFVYHSLDLTDGLAVNHFVREQRPDYIVHAAAMTQVDYCEGHQVECWNNNVTATRFLLDAAHAYRPYFLFVSTDFVFSGDGGPYKETDVPDPVNYYGSSKLAAEHAVWHSGLPAAVARTCLVYGEQKGHRSTLVNWVKNSLEAGKAIRVVNDQWRTPTYVNDLAKGIALMIEKKAEGLYHISGEEMLTPYDMAAATARRFGLDEKLLSTADAGNLSETARRPPKTGFVIDKAKEELGFQPVSFAEALQLISA